MTTRRRRPTESIGQMEFGFPETTTPSAPTPRHPPSPAVMGIEIPGAVSSGGFLADPVRPQKFDLAETAESDEPPDRHKHLEMPPRPPMDISDLPEPVQEETPKSNFYFDDDLELLHRATLPKSLREYMCQQAWKKRPVRLPEDRPRRILTL